MRDLDCADKNPDRVKGRKLRWSNQYGNSNRQPVRIYKCSHASACNKPQVSGPYCAKHGAEERRKWCQVHDADDVCPGRICGRPMPCRDHASR